MRYVAAYMLATLGGNQNPSAADVEKILSSVGIEVNSAQVQDLIAKLEGKNVDAVIAEGFGKLASMPAGGAAAPAAASGAAAPAAAAKETKKVEKEESDEDMGFGLFD